MFSSSFRRQASSTFYALPKTITKGAAAQVTTTTSRFMSSSSSSSSVAAAANTRRVSPPRFVPPRVLSVQSHIVYGFVGNKAATFPLQTMGFNVDCINSVCLSNHPNYKGGCKGGSLNNHEFTELIQGLENNHLLGYDLILSGYIRSDQVLSSLADSIRKIKQHSTSSSSPSVSNSTVEKEVIYICDPVLGDNGSYYVPEELKDVYKTKLFPLATAITPNFFEAQVLSGITISSFHDAFNACKVLHSYGPSICILTGMLFNNEATTSTTTTTAVGISSSSSSLKNDGDDYNGAFSVIVSIKSSPQQQQQQQEENENGENHFDVFRVDLKKIGGQFSGCGDLFASLLSAGLYNYMQIEKAKRLPFILAQIVAHAARVMEDVLCITHETSSVELPIIECRDAYIEYESKLKQLCQVYSSPTPSSPEQHASVSSSFAPHPTFSPMFRDSTPWLLHSSSTLLPPQLAQLQSPLALSASASASIELHPLPPQIYRAGTTGNMIVGVIFDMDGTLTEPGAIDFDKMYERNAHLGIVKGYLAGGILAQIERLENEQHRLEATQVVEEEEVLGCDRMEMRPHLEELLASLHRHGMRAAISTRNCEKALEVFLRRANLLKLKQEQLEEQEQEQLLTAVSSGHNILGFHPCLHRHSLEGGINKPDPRVSQHILQEWGILPGQEGKVWFVGDSEDDIKCGKAAGCVTCLVATPENSKFREENAHLIDHTVHTLNELKELLGLN